MFSSASVGTLGSAATRLGAATASARSLPDCTCGSDDGMLSNRISTWPASTSFSAGPAPRYGMCTMKVPLVALNSSPIMWPIPQVPEEA